MSLLRKKTVTQILSDAAEGESSKLVKTLGVRDLTSFGIAAIIGAGIFSTIGLASYNGGPAVSLLFVFTAIACVFTALSYAQFASTVPVSGSAYTYAYVAFGEIFAWIIGWALILEYAVSNMVVAISWSEYFTSMLSGFGITFPKVLCYRLWLSIACLRRWLSKPGWPEHRSTHCPKIHVFWPMPMPMRPLLVISI